MKFPSPTAEPAVPWTWPPTPPLPPARVLLGGVVHLCDGIVQLIDALPAPETKTCWQDARMQRAQGRAGAAEQRRALVDYESI
jgi:hypothetical protein